MPTEQIIRQSHEMKHPIRTGLPKWFEISEGTRLKLFNGNPSYLIVIMPSTDPENIGVFDREEFQNIGDSKWHICKNTLNPVWCRKLPGDL